MYSITMQTALFLALFLCFSPIEGKSPEAGETCVGIRRVDSSFYFDLPDAVAENLQDHSCDAEWSVNQFTATLDGNSINFSHPFIKVTRHGISLPYCPFSVRFHVSCAKYTNELMCSCTNSTESNPVFNTTPPAGGAIKTDSSVRQHYCAIAVVATFALILLILAFCFCKTNSTAKHAPVDENQPGSAELA